MKPNAEYRRLLSKTRALLAADVPPCAERDRALADFAALLADAEQREEPADALFPDGYDAFYRDLLSTLPARTTEQIYARRRRRRALLSTASAGLIAGVILSALIASGQMGVWVEGIGYVVGNPDKYNYTPATDLYSYSLTVDLSRPDEMLGRAIYAQDNGTITLADLEYRQENWRVGFRSHGEYSPQRATLVSGLAHTHSERGFSYRMTATLTATWKGVDYPCLVMGESGINYRDGDDFSFCLPAEIPPDAGEITLTITDLTVNRWSRKP